MFATFTLLTCLVGGPLATLSPKQSADPHKPASVTAIADDGQSQGQGPNATRPKALVPLYLVYGGLASGEFAATKIGRSRGAAEANPVTFFNGNPTLQAGLAIGVGAFTIWVAENQWRGGHRVAAIVTLLIVDSINAALLWHDVRWLKNH